MRIWKKRHASLIGRNASRRELSLQPTFSKVRFRLPGFPKHNQYCIVQSLFNFDELSIVLNESLFRSKFLILSKCFRSVFNAKLNVKLVI